MMASTFVWPRLGGREKTPSELTEKELQAWKTSGFYPNRVALKAPQGDGPSSTVTHTTIMQSAELTPTLNDKWIAAQHNFDANQQALKQPTVKQEQMVATTSRWAAAQAAYDAKQENNKPAKRSWGDAQIAYDPKSDGVINNGTTTTKKQDDGTATSGHWIPPHLRTSLSDRAKNTTVAKQPAHGFTTSSWGQSSVAAEVKHSNSAPQVGDSSALKPVKKLSWGDVQAAYDKRNGTQGSAIKQGIDDSAAAWNTPNQHSHPEELESTIPTQSSVHTSSAAPAWCMDQAISHVAQAPTSKQHIHQPPLLVGASSSQESRLNEESSRNKSIGGGLQKSRWANVQAAYDLRNAKSNERTSETLKQQQVPIATMPIEEAVPKNSVVPTPLVAEYSTSHAGWRSTGKVDSEQRRYSAASHFTPMQAVGGLQNANERVPDCIHSIQPVHSSDETYISPLAPKVQHRGGMASPVAGEASLTMENLRELTTPSKSENKKGGGSMISKGSALMNSRWGPTVRQGALLTARSETPAQPLRPEAAAFTSTTFSADPKLDTFSWRSAPAPGAQTQRDVESKKTQEVSLEHVASPWATQTVPGIEKQHDHSVIANAASSNAFPLHLRSQITDQQPSRNLFHVSEIATCSQSQVFPATVLATEKTDPTVKVVFSRPSAGLALHLRTETRTGPGGPQSNEPAVPRQQNIARLYDDDSVPPPAEGYMISRHPWSGPNTTSKRSGDFTTQSPDISPCNSLVTPAARISTVQHSSGNVQPQPLLKESSLETWERAVPSPAPLPVAIQLVQGITTAQDASISQERTTDTGFGTSQSVNGIATPTVAKTPTPFDPNKYGKPPKIKQDLGAKVGEAPTRHSAAVFDPTSLSMEAFSQQMESSRNQNSHGKVWQRTVDIQQIEEDPMFGKRAGLQTWATSGDAQQAAVINSISTVAYNTAVKAAQSIPTLKQPASMTIPPGTAPIQNNWPVLPNTAFFMGKVSPAVVATPDVPLTRNNPANDAKLVDSKVKDTFNKLVMADLKTKDDFVQTATPLTSQRLAIATGERQDIRSNVDSFDEKISDTGIVKEGVRARQGVDATGEFYDFDGSRLPAPVDWDGRKPIDTSYVNAYIVEWTKNYTKDINIVDTSSTNFEKGRPIGVQDKYASITHDQVLQADPNLGDAVTVPSTANEAIDKAKFKKAAQYDDDVETARLLQQRQRELAAKAPEIDPYAAKVNMYLRPAVAKDAEGIAAIYNQYIKNSILPEDQKAVKADVLERCITNCRKNELPFIVAVKGNPPPSKDALGRLPQPGTEVLLPQHEIIFGFAYAEIYNFGLSGSFAGRSRCNVVLQLYVDQKHQHQGVGRNLMDRMMHILSPTYGHRDVVPWVKPPAKLGNAYDSTKAERWHSLFFYLPVSDQEDEEFNRVSRFLGRYYIQKLCVLKGAARTSIEDGHGKFADLAIFQGTAIPIDSFGPFA